MNTNRSKALPCGPAQGAEGFAAPLDRHLSAAPAEHRRVAAYIRVSTDLRDQENSYAVQERAFTAQIRRNPAWIPAGIYADRGLSGTDGERRPGFRRLLRHCAEGRIDHVVCKSVSRFARNTADFLAALALLRRHQVTIFFEREGLNTADPGHAFVFAALAAIAQEESRSIAGNVRRGNRMRFSAGDVPNEAVYGYRFTEAMVTSPTGYRYRAVEIIPEQAEVVRRIFRETAAGARYVDLARALNRAGIPAPETHYTRTRRVKPARGQLYSGLEEGWTGGVISRIVRTERYTGDVLVQKTCTPDLPARGQRPNAGTLPQYLVRDHHPAVVSRALFQAANNAADRHRQTHPRRPCLPRPLSGRLVCARCGRYFCVRNVKHNPIWYCPSTRDHGLALCGAEPLYEAALLLTLRQAVTVRFGAEPDGLVSALRRTLELVQVPDHAERDRAFLTEQIAAGNPTAAERLAALEAFRAESERDHAVRGETLAWLRTVPDDAGGVRQVLEGLAGERLGAAVRFVSVDSSRTCTVHWCDGSTTEAPIASAAPVRGRRRT